MRYAKAIVAALAAATAALAQALTSGDTVTAGEWVTVALAALGTLGLTYVIPNAPPNPDDDP